MSNLIQINDLCVKYGKIEALRDLNLTINEGEYIGIIGANGGGKSTLLKTILGLTKQYKGTITYNGTTLKKSNLSIGYVPQTNELNRMFPITVEEVVLTAKIPLKKSFFYRYSDEDHKEVNTVLEKVGLSKIKERQISDLSGGEFQKLLIARALALNPNILLLDEPTAMVDIKSQKQIYTLIKRLSREMTIVMVTHHVKDITKQAGKLIFLERNILAEGDPEEVYKYAYLKPVGVLNREPRSREVTRV
ncbi:MAG: metal ABC transporter ATP-binding protein [Bacilli bacterium]|nr:metal ABC transporter ATP-binding protein [Bacilli bacterium]MBN2876662.1 metal ABC transporter ATP-binding protein [Bacilli bacterium]